MTTIRLNPLILSATAVAAGAALLFTSWAVAASPEVTTQAATAVTDSDATLHAMNGDTDATGSAFWVSTSTFSVASSSSPTLPSGVFSTGDLGAKASSTAFSADLSDADIPSQLGVTASTTFHYVAWVELDGVWYPGELMTVTTASTSATTTPAVAPTISNITVTNIGTSTAKISWTTDTAATGQVVFGTSTSYGSTSALNTTASTTHSVTLTNLNQGTLYHFAVRSGNGAGTTTSSDQTLVTSSTASSTPLSVDSITAVDTTAVADGTFENGWKWVIRFTVPDNEDAFRIQFTNWRNVAATTTTFATANNVRISVSQGENATTSSSGLMLSGANAYSDWIYLTGDASSSTPGRQIDVTVEVRIPVGTTPGSYSADFVANSTPRTATSTTH